MLIMKSVLKLAWGFFVFLVAGLASELVKLGPSWDQFGDPSAL